MARRFPVRRPRKDSGAIFFHPETPFKRRRHAVIAAEILAISSQIDVEVGVLLCRLLGKNAGPTVAMYQSIRNATARENAVVAALSDVLDKEQQKTLRKILSFVESAQKSRHRIAHWLWGYDLADPDSIYLMDPILQLQVMEFAVHLKEGDSLPGGTLRTPAAQIRLTVEDMRADLAKLEMAEAAITLFSHGAAGYHFSDDPDGALVGSTRDLLSRLLATQGSQESQAQARQRKSEARQRQRDAARQGASATNPTKRSRKRSPSADT